MNGNRLFSTLSAFLYAVCTAQMLAWMNRKMPNDRAQRRAGAMPAKHGDASRRVRWSAWLAVISEPLGGSETFNGGIVPRT